MDFFVNRPGSKPQTQELSPAMNTLTEAIIGACIEVHRHLGPGLGEAMYEIAVCHELTLRGIPFEKQAPVDVYYKGVAIGDCRIDLLVDGKVIVELKACQQLAEVHRAKLITYLSITRLTVGLLINFNVPRLTDGLKRVVRTACIPS